MWKSLLIGFGGAVMGAFGSYVVTRGAAARQFENQMKLGRRERTEAACLELIELLTPVHAAIRFSLPKLADQGDTAALDKLWAHTDELMAKVSFAWNERLSVRIGSLELVDAVEAMWVAWGQAVTEKRTGSSPPREELWADLEALVDEVEEVRTLAYVLTGLKPRSLARR